MRHQHILLCGRQVPVLLACFFSPMILRKRMRTLHRHGTGLHSHPCSSRPRRYIHVPASLIVERFPSIMTARKRASQNRHLPSCQRLWQVIEVLCFCQRFGRHQHICFVNNKPSVLSESKADKFWSTPAAHAFCAQNGASKILFISRLTSLELDEP